MIYRETTLVLFSREASRLLHRPHHPFFRPAFFYALSNRSQRSLQSESPSVMFHYPPEASETDRVAINSMDEARTQDGEFLNDSLVDLYLK